MAINRYQSIIPSSVNGLNTPCKRHGNLMNKKNKIHTHSLSTRDPPQNERTYTYTKIKGKKRYFMQKKVE